MTVLYNKQYLGSNFPTTLPVPPAQRNRDFNSLIRGKKEYQYYTYFFFSAKRVPGKVTGVVTAL